MQAVAALTDWLTASGGLLVFGATAALAVLASKQMGKMADQAKAAQEQVKIMRKAAEAEAAAVKEQIEASIKQGEAIREAARAQLQPMVFAHGDRTHTYPEPADDVVLGPRENEYMLGPGQVGFGYKLANEGTGLALNIRHGVDVGGKRLAFGDGMRSRALRPGESQPPKDFLDQGVWIRITPFFVVCPESELPANWQTQPRHYWAEFESVFGEGFKTLNPSSPELPAYFAPLDNGDGGGPA